VHQRIQGSATSQYTFFNKAPVFGFARSFVSSIAIPNATITVLEDPTLRYQTDNEGKFGPIMWTVGAPITLRLEKSGSWWSGYRTTQTATLIVPPEGINHDRYVKNVSFQIVSNMAFSCISWVMGKAENPETGQLAVTVTPPNITMDDIPQGEPDVVISIEPDPGVKPYYLGIIPWLHKTNFFRCQQLQATTRDGGVIFPDIPTGVYKITARKGERIAEIEARVDKGVITNASPPVGLVL
jgi:hypothetical protein